MYMSATATDAASVVNILINTVLLVAVFLAKWELSRIDGRIHRIEDIFFSRGVQEIVKQHRNEREL